MRREWLGFESSEIGQLLDLSQETIRTALHRARQFASVHVCPGPFRWKFHKSFCKSCCATVAGSTSCCRRPWTSLWGGAIDCA
jgi:hypothetical protein